MQMGTESRVSLVSRVFTHKFATNCKLFAHGIKKVYLATIIIIQNLLNSDYDNTILVNKRLGYSEAVFTR